MKKALLITALLAGSGRLMAQNDLKLPEMPPLPVFTFKTDTSLRLPSLNGLANIAGANTLKNLTSLQSIKPMDFYETKLIGQTEGYTTPIAVLPGKSNMPIVKIGGNYNMPVAGKPRKKEQITIVP